MTLSVISFAFGAILAHKVVHSNYLDMRSRMPRLFRLRCTLLSSASIETLIGHLLLESLDLFLEFVD